MYIKCPVLNPDTCGCRASCCRALMSSTEDPYCRGSKPGEDSCDCEMFSSSDNPKRCMECGHGESKHGPSWARNPPSSVPVPTSKNLSDIFSDISGTVPRSTPLPTGALSRPTPLPNGIVSRTAAHNEALYTKVTGSSRMSQPTKASKRAPTSTDRKVSIPFKCSQWNYSHWFQASNASPPGRPFRVQLIALLTCGLTVSPPFLIHYIKLNISKGRGKMFDEMLPTNPTQKTQFRLRLENHGCLIQNPDGYSINASWTYDQVTDALRAWFPKPFQHIESRQKSKAKSEYPDWQVVNCSGCRFTVIIEANFPTGETLRSFKGCAKAGTNESHLWLGKYSSRQMFQIIANPFFSFESHSQPYPQRCFWVLEHTNTCCRDGYWKWGKWRWKQWWWRHDQWWRGHRLVELHDRPGDQWLRYSTIVVSLHIK